MTLDDLRKIAENATEGPWEWERPSEGDFPQHDQSLVTTWKEEDGEPATVLHGWGYDASGTEAEPQDRLFIATFNPKRVLELLDQIEQLQARLNTIEELHVPPPGLGPARCTECDQLHPCDTTKEIEELHYPALMPKPRGGALEVCAHCARQMHAVEERAVWPCDTIKAVRGE